MNVYRNEAERIKSEKEYMETTMKGALEVKEDQFNALKLQLEDTKKIKEDVEK